MKIEDLDRLIQECSTIEVDGHDYHNFQWDLQDQPEGEEDEAELALAPSLETYNSSDYDHIFKAPQLLTAVLNEDGDGIQLYDDSKIKEVKFLKTMALRPGEYGFTG